MKVLIQRVKHASVTIDKKIHSSIGAGILAFVGIEKGDSSERVAKLARKIANLRIFSDEQGKMNKSIKDIHGEMLIVSQFTLCGDCKKGTRPSFDKSEVPAKAKQLYEEFIKNIKNDNIPVSTGIFGAMMEINLLNDGPVTFILEA